MPKSHDRYRFVEESQALDDLPRLFGLSPQSRLGQKLLPRGSSRERFFLNLARTRQAIKQFGIGALFDRRKREAIADPKTQAETQIGETLHVVHQELKRAERNEDVADQYARTAAVMAERGQQHGPNYVAYDPNLKPPEDPALKLIAFYLTQFHPVPENDAWWGRGFTEWTNVSKTVPQFVGHYQPHLPDELGFYDLRVREVQERQVQLAKQYGIQGFCFYYYWFDGRRVLEKPLNTFVENPNIDLPFCILWANENWTKRWDGRDDDILLGQNYSPESDLRFIQDLRPLLEHRNYIRVNGRPVIGVYHPKHLPDPRQTAERWRNYCTQNSLGDPLLVAAQTFEFEDPQEIGFDAAVQFPPHNEHRDESLRIPYQHGALRIINPSYQGAIFSYPKLVTQKLADNRAREYPMYETVFPNWDNTPRQPESGLIYAFSSPGLYKKWLRASSRRTIERLKDKENRLLFINAWNEWAETAHLEPDRRYGFAYLNATREVLDALSVPEQAPAQTERIAVDDKDIALLEISGVPMSGVEEAIRNAQPTGKVLRAAINAFGEYPSRSIVIVRDPLRKRIAAFLESLRTESPTLAARWQSDDLATEELHELYFNFSNECDEEEEQVAKLSTAPFPQGQGYQIITKENKSILILRFEDADRVGAKAIEEFLNVKVGQPKTDEDPTIKGLLEIFADKPLPQSYIDPIYETHYATRFYTAQEIYNARKRWLHR